MGSGNGIPALSPRDIDLLGRHSESAPPNQPSVPPDANWCYTTGTSRSSGERFLALGHGCVPHAEWLSRYNATVLLNGAHVRYKGDDGLWWLLGRPARTRLRMGYIWCAFWMTRDRSIFLFHRRATRLRRELYEILGVCKYT